MKMIFCNNSESFLVTPLCDMGRYNDEWGNPPVQPPSWDNAVDGMPLTLEVRAADGKELNLPWISSSNDRGEIFPVTLTHESVPGVFEIVYVKAIEGNVLHVHQRGAEGTGWLFWPVGTKVSANITEGMLQHFAQQDGSTATLKPETRSIFLSGAPADLDGEETDLVGYGSFLFMARSPLRELLQFNAYPILHPVPSIKPHSRWNYKDHGAGLSHEASGNSYPVDIGEPPTWVAGRLSHGAVCLPVTPNGYQYWFDKLIETGSSWNFSAETEPDFYTDPSAVIEMRRDIDGDEFMGKFVPTPMPVVQILMFKHSMIPTEVGFCGVVDQGVTQMPVISVGSYDDPTKYVNAVSLSSLVHHEEEEQSSVHRIPLSVGGPLTSALKFTVNQAAVGGSVRGFFYWRGLFFSMKSED